MFHLEIIIVIISIFYWSDWQFQLSNFVYFACWLLHHISQGHVMFNLHLLNASLQINYLLRNGCQKISFHQCMYFRWPYISQSMKAHWITTIAGLLLFLIYIDGITSIPISSGTQTVLYADGLLLFHQISRQEDFTTLQRDIIANEQLVLDNHLTFKILLYDAI